MEKASVVIGFLTQRPRVDIPSYYEPVIVEKTYKGDISRSYRRNQQDYNSTIDSVILNEEFQTVMNEFLKCNLNSAVYIKRYGNKWAINSITPEYPKITFSIGGKYNDEETSELRCCCE